MFFCPNCANLLLVDAGPSANMRFFCLTCPYVFMIRNKISKRLPLKKKQIEPVLGGANAWKNAQKTEAVCPKCNNKEAYFLQVQTRSADEPMTIFYRCANEECSFRWTEN
eukprot:TRINITY_DN16539_c0_g1_i1.p2 TRINITY_DN16539_c0_g1~~TRINITY_DN16539_c0_g1_i1.p2  ORF type:complete len:110 (-),score=19.47 TRINITY_DN16539_c0_g1_i1:220-549(-)